MKEPREENHFERYKQKKHTYQIDNIKFNLKKSFDKPQNKKNLRCYSTKLFINFVPKITPKKSFCKPTFFQLNEEEKKNENDKSFELAKIESCDEYENESVDSSSIMSSSSDINKEEKNDTQMHTPLQNENENLIKSEQKEYNEDIFYFPEIKKDSNADEYDNLAYKKKYSMHEKDEKEENGIKSMRKEMSKIKSKNVLTKCKETEEIINQNMKNNFHIGINNFCLDDDEEKENKEENKENKNNHFLIDKKYISNKNFSILDILAIKNKNNYYCKNSK